MKFVAAREYKGHVFDDNPLHVARPQNMKLYKWLQQNTNNPERYFEFRRVPKFVYDEENGGKIQYESRVVGVFTDHYDSNYNPVRKWTELGLGDVVYFEDIKETRLKVMSAMEFKTNYTEKNA